MNNDCLLLIFAKNPILGKAKTRLAASVGDEKALEIYRFLLDYTAQMAQAVAATRQVCYTHYIGQDDAFPDAVFEKTMQQTGDLGERMQAAFASAFAAGYQRVVIIGSDCYELSSELLQEAFDTLAHKDFVIGPAKDGGYYLLGMRQLTPKLFENKAWSQAGLADATVADFDALNASYTRLPLLSDIDYLENLPATVRTKFEV